MMRVTQVLRGAGLCDMSFVDEAAMKRGTAVHLATELDDLGELEESSVDPVVAPYLAGWRRFRTEMKPQIVTIEEKVSDQLAGYRGTLDRRVYLDNKHWVIDIKTGSPAPWHAIQLAGYAAVFTPNPRYRAGVYLPGDGSYRFVEYSDRQDYEVWRSALRIAKWRFAHGLYNIEEELK